MKAQHLLYELNSLPTNRVGNGDEPASDRFRRHDLVGVTAPLRSAGVGAGCVPAVGEEEVDCAVVEFEGAVVVVLAEDGLTDASALVLVSAGCDDGR